MCISIELYDQIANYITDTTDNKFEGETNVVASSPVSVSSSSYACGDRCRTGVALPNMFEICEIPTGLSAAPRWVMASTWLYLRVQR